MPKPCPSQFISSIKFLFSIFNTILKPSCALSPKEHCSCLGRRPLGVPGEETAVPDVAEAEVEHRHALEADTAARMGRTSIIKRLNIIFKVLRPRAISRDPLLQILRI